MANSRGKRPDNRQGSLARSSLGPVFGNSVSVVVRAATNKRSLPDPHNHMVLLQTAAIGDRLLAAASILAAQFDLEPQPRTAFRILLRR